MVGPTPPARAELFAGYEAALAGLVGVPASLERDLADARRAYDEALTTAAASITDEKERVARLRAGVVTRYREAAKGLQDAGVPVPPLVRPAAGREGDAASLAAAITAQQVAEAAVARELEAAATSARRRAAEESSRAAAGREAAEALRRRQEQVRTARAAADAEAERQHREAQARARRFRRLLAGSMVGIGIGIVLVLALLLS